MPRFRSKPREIEATQWFPWVEVPGVFEENLSRADDGNDRPVERLEPDEVRFFVVTIQRQKVYLAPGEWVVTESDGVHHYPIAADEFAKLYGPVG